jgi:hypothetical protein
LRRPAEQCRQVGCIMHVLAISVPLAHYRQEVSVFSRDREVFPQDDSSVAGRAVRVMVYHDIAVFGFLGALQLAKSVCWSIISRQSCFF